MRPKRYCSTIKFDLGSMGRMCEELHRDNLWGNTAFLEKYSILVTNLVEPKIDSIRSHRFSRYF